MIKQIDELYEELLEQYEIDHGDFNSFSEFLIATIIVERKQLEKYKNRYLKMMWSASEFVSDEELAEWWKEE